jgi:ceramide glucosyltransferase
MDEEGISKLTIVAGLVALIYYVLIWSISLLGLSQARSKYGRPSRSKNEPPLPSPQSARPLASRTTEEGDTPSEGISILRPLSGLDHNLLANLSSSFEQDFPHDLFEVILSVRNEQDQALAIAQEVCSRYPHIQSRIIIGDEPCSGVNPKIANLVRSYAAAQFDIVWVLDSQVQLGPLALHRAILAMQSSPPQSAPRFFNRRPHGTRVGLAHHCPLAVTPHSTSLGSHIEAIFLGTNHAKMYLAINALCIDSCVMGKSNFYRKSDLADVPDDFFNVSAEGTRGERGAIGSVAFQHLTNEDDESASKGAARPLARFGIFLAEDNMVGLSLWRPPLSLSHVLLDGDVARMSVGDVKSIGDYIKRRVRWIRVRRHMVPAATYIEPFTESILCGCIATWAFSHVWVPIFFNAQVSWLLQTSFILLHLYTWHRVDFAVLASLQEAGKDTNVRPIEVIDFDNPSQVWRYRLAWLCREILAFPIWFVALCGSTVTWRDRRFRILSDARAAAI